MVSALEKSSFRPTSAERFYRGLVSEFAFLFGVRIVEEKKKRVRGPKKRPLQQIADRRAAIAHHQYRLDVCEESLRIKSHPSLFVDIFVDGGVKQQILFDREAIEAQYAKIEPLRASAIRELSTKTPDSYILSRNKKT